MTDRTDIDGFALPVAILAMVVVGVLVTGGFLVAWQQSRIGMDRSNGIVAFYLAEGGIADVVQNASPSMLTGLAIWGDTTVVDSTGDGVVEVTITRTGTRTFLLDGTSTVTGGGDLRGN